jgi:processive rubber oxygenase RoxA-like protein
MKEDPFGAKGIAQGDLHKIDNTEVRQSLEQDVDLAERAHCMLKLFHNMRAALHVPDQPPEKVPPASGPGRNDAFGILSASLLNAPTPYAPIKFGLVWNVDKRTWVHWDGNTKSPIARNLLASLGLGAPLHGKHGELEFAVVKRQTDLSEKIQPPKYPFDVDLAAAKRGAAHFDAKCASCHGGPESDKRLYSVAEVGTDPNRANMFTQKVADGFNKFLADLESDGYEPPKEFGVRSTGKYWAATLNGVWARTPYLHNGSVRTMQELLTPPAQRAKSFHRGSRTYDPTQMGYTDDGAYVLDTAMTGNANSGHDYGTSLSAAEKGELMEYLKTL